MNTNGIIHIQTFDHIRKCSVCEFKLSKADDEPCFSCEQTTHPLKHADVIMIQGTRYARVEKREWIDMKYSGEGYMPNERYICPKCGAKKSVPHTYCPDCGSWNGDERK